MAQPLPRCPETPLPFGKTCASAVYLLHSRSRSSAHLGDLHWTAPLRIEAVSVSLFVHSGTTRRKAANEEDKGDRDAMAGRAPGRCKSKRENTWERKNGKAE